MENIANETGQETKKSHCAKPSASETIMIPKHRFDCVNLCLKETKQALKDKTIEAENGRIRTKELEKALLETKVETALAIAKAKNLTAAKALIDFSDLRLGNDGEIEGLKEKILSIKESQNYLFENGEALSYVLVAVKSGDPLNNSICSYIKKTEKKK